MLWEVAQPVRRSAGGGCRGESEGKAGKLFSLIRRSVG